MAMRLPRMFRIVWPSRSSAAMSTGSTPPAGSVNRICPEAICAAGGSSPMTAWEMVDLPQPDSPTSASVFACGISNDTPSTARVVPLSE